MESAKNTRSRFLFISKNEEELKIVPSWCIENDWQLVAQSFLSFEKIDFNITTSFDVVFFASPRAAQFFLESIDTSLPPFEIAVAGESTKKFVEAKGLKVHFCPENGGDVTDSSQLFARWVGQRFVLFPTSTLSQKSYTRFLPKDQFEVVTIYKTQISTNKIGISDVYVFTSPSNVSGYFANNTIPDNTRIIAWGETTATILQQHVSAALIETMHQSSEEELLQILK